MKNYNLKDKINSYLDKDYMNCEFLISGRSAIDLAIKASFLKNPNIKIYVPNYICDSMIKPFLDNKLKLNFYNVMYDGEKFDIDVKPFENEDNALVLYCDYFISNLQTYKKVVNALSSNAILIHDVTHTIFSKNYFDYRDDYIVCSLRKWFVTIDGGLCIAKTPTRCKLKEENKEYLKLKESAYKAKNVYYEFPTIDNREYYDKLSEMAEYELNNNYSLYKMSAQTANIIKNANMDEIFKKRSMMFDMIRSLLVDYNILEGATKENCIFTIPLVKLHDRDKVYNELKQLLIRCAVMWDFGVDEIYKEFVDKSLCIDISDNTIKKLRRER